MIQQTNQTTNIQPNKEMINKLKQAQKNYDI